MDQSVSFSDIPAGDYGYEVKVAPAYLCACGEITVAAEGVTSVTVTLYAEALDITKVGSTLNPAPEFDAATAISEHAPAVVARTTGTTLPWRDAGNVETDR